MLYYNPETFEVVRSDKKDQNLENHSKFFKGQKDLQDQYSLKDLIKLAEVNGVKVEKEDKKTISTAIWVKWMNESVINKNPVKLTSKTKTDKVVKSYKLLEKDVNLSKIKTKQAVLVWRALMDFVDENNNDTFIDSEVCKYMDKLSAEGFFSGNGEDKKTVQKGSRLYAYYRPLLELKKIIERVS